MEAHFFYRGGILIFFLCAAFVFIRRFERRAAEQHAHSAAQVAQFLKVVLFAIGGICLLQLLDIPLSGLLAFGGMGGIAIGFAAKDLFANVFGAFMIFLDHPFQVGDQVRSPTQAIEGTVEHIGWRITRIRTPCKSLIFVPNMVFSTLIVDNLSRMTHQQIQIKLTLDPMNVVETRRTISEIEAYLEAHPEIHQGFPPFVYLVNWNPLGPEIAIQTYTQTTDPLKYRKLQQEILFGILALPNRPKPSIPLVIQKLELPTSGSHCFWDLLASPNPLGLRFFKHRLRLTQNQGASLAAPNF